MPDKICRTCKFQLEKSYNFRKKCEQSDMKLRQHLRELRELELVNAEQADDVMEIEDINDELSEKENSQAGPSTEEDLVGVAKVTYIQQDPEPEPDPDNITLPIQTDNTVKEACTLNVDDLKSEIDTENEELENSFIITETDQNHQVMTETSMDAIADAVKATLASHTGNKNRFKAFMTV